MVICAGMVPFICADGHIRLPYLAQRHQGLSDQGKPDNIHYSIIPEYLVVVRFLWLEVTPLRPYRDRPTVDCHITANHQFLSCFENRFLSSDTLYYLDKLRHCAKFLYLYTESVAWRRSIESLPVEHPQHDEPGCAHNVPQRVVTDQPWYHNVAMPVTTIPQ